MGHVRRRVLQGGDLTDLADDLQRLATAAFALLEDGLRNFAVAAPTNTRLPVRSRGESTARSAGA
jgi:hypothetical protein